MAKYIDAEKVISAIQAAYVDTQEGFDKAAVKINVGLTKALHIIQDTTDADVVETDAIKNLVEVVMCRDCKRYTENCFCEFWQKTGAVIQMSTYDFCSYGERLEE